MCRYFGRRFNETLENVNVYRVHDCPFLPLHYFLLLHIFYCCNVFAASFSERRLHFRELQLLPHTTHRYFIAHHARSLVGTCLSRFSGFAPDLQFELTKPHPLQRHATHITTHALERCADKLAAGSMKRWQTLTVVVHNSPSESCSCSHKIKRVNSSHTKLQN